MISVDDLLSPVPGEVPHGSDLRNPSSHPLLSDLRSAWRTARQREERPDIRSPADWKAVERQAAAILAGHSKDLEVAAWLAEALLYTDGFAGAAAGGALIAGLVERFWDGLYPAPFADEPAVGAEEARLEPLGHLAGAEGRLLPPVRRVVLFTLADGTGFCFSDCQESKAWTALRPEQRTQRLGSLVPDRRAAFEQSAGAKLWNVVQPAARADAADLLADQRDAITAARDAWRAVAAALDHRAGAGRFSAAALIGLLEEVLRTVNELAPPAVAAPDAPTQEAAPAAGSGPAAGVNGREQALRQLEDIAAFFRRTEPHSPLAFTLQEAMRRARLSWPELLAEVVPDKGQREAILSRLGIRPDAT